MTKTEQTKLAEDLARSFSAAYLEMASHAPEDWTGFELRQLLVDCAKERFAYPLGTARAKTYRNARATIAGL